VLALGSLLQTVDGVQYLSLRGAIREFNHMKRGEYVGAAKHKCSPPLRRLQKMSERQTS